MAEVSVQLIQGSDVVSLLCVKSLVKKSSIDYLHIMEDKHIESQLNVRSERKGFLKKVDDVKEEQKHESRYILGKDSYFVHMLILASYNIFQMSAYMGFNIHGEKEFTIIHVLCIHFSLILPLLLMHVFIGQYSKMGCSVIGKIVPITSGIEYTVLILTYIEVLKSTIFLMDCLNYCAKSFTSSQLPWMTCKREYRVHCVDKFNYGSCADLNITGYCAVEKYQLSSWQYLHYDFLGHDLAEQFHDPRVRLGSNFPTNRIAFLSIGCLMVFYISRKMPSKSPKLLRFIFRFYLVSLLTLLLLICLLLDGAQNEMKSVVHLYKGPIDQGKLWGNALRNVLTSCNLAVASTTQFGSYFPPHSRTSNQVLIAGGYVFLFYSLNGFLLSAMRGTLAHTLNIDLREQSLESSSREIIFVMFPFLYGTLLAPQAWSAFFFLFGSVTCLFKASLLLDVIIDTIFDLQNRFTPYRIYLTTGLCLSLFIVLLPFTAETTYALYDGVLMNLSLALTLIIYIVEAVAVFWIYSVRKLCDDYQFKMGTTLHSYWKLCWWFMPVLLVMALFFLLNTSTRYETPVVLLSLLTLFILVPQIIGLIQKTFQYMQQRDLTHMFQPEETWGDPDPEERHAREQFHPRDDVRSRRRKVICKHNCLLASPILQLLVEQEELERAKAIKSQLNMPHIYPSGHFSK